MLLEFVSRMSASGALLGNYDATERLLKQYLPAERVGGIMDEIRGPAGRNMWEKLANVQEEVLANYLDRYPQTVAVVLSKIASRTCRARSLDYQGTVTRLRQPHAEDGGGAEGGYRPVGQDLRAEFMSNLSQTRRRDPHEVMRDQ